MMHRPLLALSLTIAVAAFAADQGTPPGSITFEGKNVVSTAHGTFHRWRVVRAEIDPAQPRTGVVEVEVEIASLETGIERRDNHLRTADFFDAGKFPTARVRVHDAEPDGQSERGNARYRARFDLEIHGVKKTVEGQFEVTQASPPTVEGGLTLNRVDFGVGDPYTWWIPGSIEEQVPVRFRAVLPAPR
jgi:polyisoprenoid-binding protein YceI